MSQTVKWIGKAAAFPRQSLGTWPTPVEPLHLSGVPKDRQLWVKRDDLSSSLYGGNKVRKLEFLLAATKGSIVTVGALGSHHVLATAVHARALGRDCTGILVPQPLEQHALATNALIEQVCDRVIRLDRPVEGTVAALRTVLALARKTVLREPFSLIPPGGSTPLGNLGYVLAGLELAEQVAEGQCPCPDEIYLPLGTGGTAVGLGLGLALAGLKTEVIAIRVASKLSGNTRFLKVLTARTFALLNSGNCRETMPEVRIRISNDFIGKGYGHPTSEAKSAISQVSKIALETTYSAKAMAGMIESALRGSVDKVRMFLDTYGPITDLKLP